MYLHNYYEHFELPDPEIYSCQGDGINISSTKLTREVIENCHRHGKTVGVWVNAEVFIENDEFYRNAIEMGVDIICTDYPLEANRVRAQIEQEQAERELFNSQTQIQPT